MLSSQEKYFARTKVLERSAVVFTHYICDEETKRILDVIYDEMVINFE